MNFEIQSLNMCVCSLNGRRQIAAQCDVHTARPSQLCVSLWSRKFRYFTKLYSVKLPSVKRNKKLNSVKRKLET